VYRGTENKSATKYLTKKDIENVIKNIEENKGKTITIKTAFSKVMQYEKEKFKNEVIRDMIKEYATLNTGETIKDIKEKKYGLKNIVKILELLQVNIGKEKELKTETKEAGIQIKKLNKEIETIKSTLTEKGIKAKAEKEKIEVSVFRLLFGDKNKYDDFKEKEDYTKSLKWLYELAKTDKRRQERNEIQRRHNKKKKAESGKPKKET
jgi:hypothetical protein